MEEAKDSGLGRLNRLELAACFYAILLAVEVYLCNLFATVSKNAQ